MRKMQDFKCPCGKEVRESLVYDYERETCSCGKEMIRVVGSSNLGGFDKWGRSV